MLLIVTTKPVTLTAVSWSWNTTPAALIVMTSLNIPQMLNVTTDERFKRANSDEIMQKASTPGKIKRTSPNPVP